MTSLSPVGALSLGLGCAVILAACSDADETRDETPSVNVPWDEVTTETQTTDPLVVVVAAVEALDEHWQAIARSTEEGPLLRGGVRAGDMTAKDEAARCGDRVIAPEELANNALYCPADDSMVLDVEGLGRTTLVRHGVIGMALVTAHEVGHALQSRTGSNLDPLVAELQADCWAGEFAASIAEARIPGWTASRTEMALPARALLELRDEPGTAPDDIGAHGTGLDRLSAFLDGFEGGPDRCLEYSTEPPVVTGVRFVDADQSITGGRLPLSELVLVARRDLDAHYSRVATGIGLTWRPTVRIEMVDGTGCEGAARSATVQFCGDDVVIAQREDLEALASTGDGAVMAELARGWTMEAALRWPATFESSTATAECLVGFWLGSHHPGARSAAEYPYVLAPSALDEVVDAMLEDSARTDPLARLAALLDGFHGGRKACETPPPVTSTTKEEP